jgi:cytochrome c oxidase assembly protein subunit 15
MRQAYLPDRSQAVALWLFAVAVLVFTMVIVGGATRLTESGLSITEWKPISGALPPWSHQAWLSEFGKYRQIPQFRQLNPDMTLAGFQAIYWWEWTHRLLGRLVGLAFLVPFVVFLLMRAVPRRLIWRCGVLFALGGLQGLVGWWMVASGLTHRIEVAPERLAIHLGLALVIFCGLIWTGFEAWAGPGRPSTARRWQVGAIALAALVFLQIMLGALVAGNRAGRVYTDWPLMNGKVLPADYWAGGGLHALLHSQAAVQFNHRLGAYVLFASAVATAVLVYRSRWVPREARPLAVTLAVLVTLQALLGIVTLMNAAPLALSLLHQCLAAFVLATALAFAWRVRRA